MNIHPKITVVTVTYNAEKFLEPTLNSVIRQQYDDLEYIIIDGKSTDGTMDIVQRYRSSISLVISEPDKGIYDAMNKGLMNATGEWIIFMNAGDSFYDDKVLVRVFSREYPQECSLIFGDIMNYSRSLQVKCLFSPFVRWWNKENLGNGETTWRHAIPACHQSVFVRTDIHRVHPFQGETFPICADWNTMAAILDEGYKYEYVQEPIAWYDVEGCSSSITFSRLHEKELISRKKMGTLCKLMAVGSFRLRRSIMLSLPPPLVTKLRARFYFSMGYEKVTPPEKEYLGL